MFRSAAIPARHTAVVALDLHPQLLRALVAVIDTGSMTAASERLGFTQSALSKQVLALETAVGVRLFDRGPRGVEPTDAALRLARRAVRILDHLDAAEHELVDAQAPLQGRVTLGAFPTAAMHLAPRAIARLGEQHAGVAVEFLELSSPVAIRRLRAGRIDLAVLASGSGLDWDLTGIDHDRLASGPLLVAVALDHRFARERRIPVSELAGERWIAARGVRGEPQFGAWPTLGAPIVAAALGDWSTRLGFVAAGLGITSIPALAARALPAGVTTVEVDDPAREGRALLLAHIGTLSPAADALRQAIVEEARRTADGASTPAAPRS